MLHIMFLVYIRIFNTIVVLLCKVNVSLNSTQSIPNKFLQGKKGKCEPSNLSYFQLEIDWVRHTQCLQMSDLIEFDCETSCQSCK